MRGILLDITIGDPWDYLNGTSIDFGINAGNADPVMIAIYNFIQGAAITITAILILAALICILFSGNSQERATAKHTLQTRVVVLIALASATGILSLVMGLCNEFFGIS